MGKNQSKNKRTLLSKRTSQSTFSNEKKSYEVLIKSKHEHSAIVKANKTHGFTSCIVINVYPLDIPSFKKLQNIVIIDKSIS